MLYTPLPGDGAVPIHATAQVTLSPGEKAVVEVTPENDGVHHIPIVAASKEPDATYTVEVDNTQRFGPNSPIPPTDVDDLTVTFLRALEMESELKVTIRDVRATGSSRSFAVHVVGYEQ